MKYPIETPRGAPTKLQLRVSSRKGEEAYTSISDAIDDADPYAVITVCPGRYKERLVLTKPVTIVAEVPASETIIENEGTCIFMQTDEAKLRLLTVRGKKRFGVHSENSAAAIDIPRGQLILEECDITSETSICIKVYSSTANPAIRNCHIHHGRGKGILFTENAQGLIEDCQIKSHNAIALEIEQGSTPIIKGGQIFGNERIGIVASTNCKGRIENCHIYDNAGGVEVRPRGSLTIQECAIYKNAHYGIRVHPDGEVTVDGKTRKGISDPIFREEGGRINW